MLALDVLRYDMPRKKNGRGRDLAVQAILVGWGSVTGKSCILQSA